MCGICGFWIGGRGDTREQLDDAILRMTTSLRHRGPDDEGTWTDPACGLALGHRRLSIIDLSQEGHQPMTSSCGRYVIVYNGEVYNFIHLRQELAEAGHTFHGGSDTEVILAACAEWGVAAAVQRFIGMFAIGLWDRQQQMLHLIRDRLGIKPVSYGWAGDAFVFASEMKAVCAFPGFERRLDEGGLPLYFRFGYLPSPFSIYRGMHTLPPGAHLTLDCRDGKGQVHQERYWSARATVERLAGRRLQISCQEATDELERLLLDAVRLRLIADVPLGAFLSGGIDSSAVVALMQEASSSRVRTFSIGFAEEEYNEAPHAAAVARHLGTDHTELYVTDAEAMEVIPRIPELYDEPFADSSQIPTFLVSSLARRHVTVALTGDGGDELLGGYTRYQVIAREWQRRNRLPPALRRALESLTRIAASHDWMLWPLLPWLWLRGRSLTNLSQRARRRSRAFEDVVFSRFYHSHASFAVIPETNEILHRPEEPATELTAAGSPDLAEVVERMMYLDLIQYLPDDILTKVDRASMAVALETRVPVLDHRVVELAWQLPFACKVGSDVKECNKNLDSSCSSKAILRRLLYRRVPRQLLERPKMGFGIPYGVWLRGPLREWAEELLAPSALAVGDLFRVAEISRCWREHVAGTFDHQNLLWPVLMFQAWRRHWRVS